MLKRAVRFALSRGVEAGSVLAAEQALSGLDPLLELLALKRLDRVIAEAARTTQLDDEAHRLRIAAIMLDRRVPEAEYDDDDAISEEYSRLAAPAPPLRGPWLVGGATLGVVLGVAATIAIVVLTRPFDPSKTPAGRVLSRTLGDFIVVADRRPPSDTALARLRDAASDDRAKRALGKGTADAMGHLLDTTRALAEASPSDAKQKTDAFFAATASLDQSLDAAKLPYFVDADLLPRPGNPAPLLFSFYVERDKRVAAAGQQIRVVYLWRLDTLNVRQNYLGYTRARTPAALVLLDQIENELVRLALPAIPPGEPAELFDENTRLSHPGQIKAIEARAGKVLRRYYASMPPELRADAQRVGVLLAKRRTLVEKWQGTLRSQGLEFRVPDRLIPRAKYSKELELRIPRDQLREWDEIHESLLQPETLHAFERLRDRYAASVERHEVQHRVDYARGLVPVPPLIVSMLHVDNPLDAKPGSLAARARDELSAYLTELSEHQDSPLLALVLLSRFVLDRDLPSGPYFYAALAAFEGIGQELGLDVDAMLGRGADRQRFARLLFAVLKNTPARIQKAARGAWNQQFGAKLSAVHSGSEKQNRPWRH